MFCLLVHFLSSVLYILQLSLSTKLFMFVITFFSFKIVKSTIFKTWFSFISPMSSLELLISLVRSSIFHLFQAYL